MFAKGFGMWYVDIITERAALGCLVVRAQARLKGIDDMNGTKPNPQPQHRPEATNVISQKLAKHIIADLNAAESFGLGDKLTVILNVLNNMRLSIKPQDPDAAGGITPHNPSP